MPKKKITFRKIILEEFTKDESFFDIVQNLRNLILKFQMSSRISTFFSIKLSQMNSQKFILNFLVTKLIHFFNLIVRNTKIQLIVHESN